MRPYAVTVALVMLAACGGGDPAPRATTVPTAAPTTPAPTTQTPSPTASPTPAGVVASRDAQSIRQAVTRTLAGCPCFVTVTVSAAGAGPAQTTVFGGVYDPTVPSTTLVTIDDGEVSGRGLVIRAGRMFLKPADEDRFYELDFSRLPAKPATPLVPYALADPAVFIAAARNVSSAVSPSNTDLGVEYTTLFDSAGIVRTAKAWSPMLRRFFTTPTLSGEVVLKNGKVRRIVYETPEGGFGGGNLYVTMRIDDEKEEKPDLVPFPRVVRKVDVTREKI